MKFEEKLKKRLIKQLDKDVPNPYVKNKFTLWPLWAKIALPVGSLVLTGSIVAAIIVPNIIKNNGINIIENPPAEIVYDPLPNEGYSAACAPKNTRMVLDLDKNFVNRTSKTTIQNLEDFFKNDLNENCVLSPASYLLTISAVAAVSDNFDLEAFGLEDAREDTKTFLEALNCSYTNNNNITMCQYDAGVLHQQVGPTYEFVEEKREEVSDYYIGTARANLGNYVKQAEQYFADKVGLTIPIPNPKLRGDGVVTYGALKMHDQCDAFDTENNKFYIDGSDDPVSVPTAVLGTETKPRTTSFYQSDDYLAFILSIYSTRMLIVLPNKDVSLESISLSEAYDNYLHARFTSTKVYGYLPYFHLKTLSVELTEYVLSKMTGNELLYSKLLKEGVRSDSLNIHCYQSSDFQFSDKGIDAQSITVFDVSSSMSPKLLTEIKVDRPFYAITLKDDFPMFICKVNNPLA